MSEERISNLPENEQELFNQDGKKGVELTLEEQELLLELHRKAKVSSKLMSIFGLLQFLFALLVCVGFVVPAIVISTVYGETYPELATAATAMTVTGIVYPLVLLVMGVLVRGRGKVESYFCSPAIKREPICIVSHHTAKLPFLVYFILSIVFLSPFAIVALVFDKKTRDFVADEENMAMFLAMEQRTLETQKY